MPKKEPLYPHVPKSEKGQEPNIEIERYHGTIRVTDKRIYFEQT